MAIVSAAELVDYCKEDPEAEGELLALAESAEEYLRTGGVPEYRRSSPVYALAIKGIVLHWHDNRTGSEDFGPGLRTIINQLKFAK